MKLSKDIIRNLIKEEISEMCAADQYKMASDDKHQDYHHQDDEGDMAKRQMFKTAEYATAIFDMIQDEISEMGCGAPETNISMGVDHDEDHEGNMAKRQMFKTAEYAAEIFDNIQDGDEFPAWIQSKMTKVADYIGAVKHYLEYDHVMGEKLDKDADAGDYVKDFRKSDAPQFKGKSKKKKQQMAVAAYLDAKDNK